MNRLLIALPAAAVVVVGLTWAMSTIVPLDRPQIRYTVQISEKRVWIRRHCHDCNGEPVPHVFPPDPDDLEMSRRLPPPPRPQPERGEQQNIPRKRLPAPEPDKPESLDYRVTDHCEPYLQPVWPYSFPEKARASEYVIVEFTITADGTLKDIKVVDSSNPEINEEIVRMLQHWRVAPPSTCKELVAPRIEPRSMRTRLEFEREEAE